MYFNEPYNFKAIPNNILRTLLIIILSLTSYPKGSTSHVQMNNTQRNEEFLRSINPKTLLEDSAFGNIASLPSKTTLLSTVKNEKHQRAQTYQKNVINNEDGRSEEESQKLLNISFASNANEQFTKRLPTHKDEDLLNSNVSNNFLMNKSSNTLNRSGFNTPMYFGTANSTIIATQIGVTAHIPCVVHHIGDGVVSWIRKKDYHLLTVGVNTYCSDERFSVTHFKHSEDWTLQIRFVQQRDAGLYECQVSTHPPTSIFLHLLVVEARAEISGPTVRYLTPGSTLRLQCHVVHNTESSEFIFWYHDNRMINYDTDRGINVSTETDFQSSELIISRTRREHSGNYTCIASSTQPASVLVHIFKGDNPAAMYHGHVGSSTKSYQTHRLHIVMTAFAMIYGSYVKRI